MYNFENCVKIDVINIEDFPYHMNKNLRILYVLSGEIELSFVSGKQLIKQSEIEIININEPVAISKKTDDNAIAIYEIDMEFAKKYCDDVDTVTYNCNCAFFFPSKAKKEDQNYLKERLIHLYKIYVNQNTHYKLPAEVMEIVLLIKEKFNDIKNIFSENMKSDIHVERFLRINHFLINNIERKISLREIADSEYLSPYYISKEFNEKLNKSFHAVIDYYRVKKAVKFLISTDKSITTISEECGFSANRYFYDKFRFYMGCTPIQFRKKSRKKIPSGRRLTFESGITDNFFDSAEKELENINKSVTNIILENETAETGKRENIRKKLLIVNKIKDKWKNTEQLIDVVLKEKIGDCITSAEFMSKFIKLSGDKFEQWIKKKIGDEEKILHPACRQIIDFISGITGTIIWDADNVVIWREENNVIKGILFNNGTLRKKYIISLNNIFSDGVIIKEIVSRIAIKDFKNICIISDNLAVKLAGTIISFDRIDRENMICEVIVEKKDIILLTILPRI